MKKSILLCTLFLTLLVNGFAQVPTSTTAPAEVPPVSKGNKSGKIKDHANPKHAEHGQNTAQTGQNKGQKGKEHGQGANKMKNDFGLTADQDAQFKAANETQKANMQKLMADKTVTKEAKEAQKAQLKADYEEQVKSIFTPEQFTKWQAARDKRSEKAEGKMAEHGNKHEGKKAEGKMKGQGKKAEGKVRSDKQAAPAESH